MPKLLGTQLPEAEKTLDGGVIVDHDDLEHGFAEVGEAEEVGGGIAVGDVQNLHLVRYGQQRFGADADPHWTSPHHRDIVSYRRLTLLANRIAEPNRRTPMRISARLDEDRSRKLAFLAAATNLGKSAILQQAIDVYYEQMSTARRRPAEILNQAGFVGCGEGTRELSERYKEDLRELVSAKHDHR